MLQEKGHIGYIDFLKGLAIVSVILLHALPKNVLVGIGAILHIWQAVPLFVFISFVLIYLKLERKSLQDYYSKQSWIKLFKRIIFPFILMEGCILTLLLLKDDTKQVASFFQNLRIGRGAYYFYIYLQIWLLAPLAFFCMRYNQKWGTVILLFVSISGNVIIKGFAPMVESCIVVRYIFIAVVAYEWLNNHESRWWRYFLPIISVIYWLLMDQYDFNPWIPNTGGWAGQQFPAYFYLFFFVNLMIYIYTKCPAYLCKLLSWCGKNSWEIYLVQMAFFLFPFDKLMPFGNSSIHLMAYCIVSLLLCIIPVYIYLKVKKSFQIQ